MSYKMFYNKELITSLLKPIVTLVVQKCLVIKNFAYFSYNVVN